MTHPLAARRAGAAHGPSCVVALCLASSAWSPSARAVEPRGFEPPLSAGQLVGLDTTRTAPPLRPFAGLVASLAAGEIDAVATRLVTSLVVGMTLIDPLELGAGISFHQADEAGLGDVRVGAKVNMLPRDQAWGLALAVDAGFPTGTARYSGEDGVTLDPRLVLDWRGDTLLAALSLGYRHRPGGALGAVQIGDALRFGAGVEGRLTGHVSLVSELEGAYGFDATPKSRATPLELRLGVRVRLSDWSLTAAAGTGLDEGYGAPELRLVVGLVWAPTPFPRPPHAPVVALPPPFEDTPIDVALVLASDPDADADGIPVPRDQCPDAPEDYDQNQDEDGCPDPDDDGDGVLDVDDKCPTEKEVINGLSDDDGCPDALPEGPAGAPQAAVTGPTLEPDGRLLLPGVIEFRSGSDVLLPEAELLLGQVARFLFAHPEIVRLRIEGHTDDFGDEEENVDLSERRAASVRRALVARGVPLDRLLPKGFGKTRPLVKNIDDTSRRSNRRVELRVILVTLGGVR